MTDPINVSELHIEWLCALMENDENLTDWERDFILNIAERLQDGRMTYFTKPQDDKLRQIAFDRLVE